MTLDTHPHRCRGLNIYITTLQYTPDQLIYFQNGNAKIYIDLHVLSASGLDIMTITADASKLTSPQWGLSPLSGGVLLSTTTGLYIPLEDDS